MKLLEEKELPQMVLTSKEAAEVLKISLPTFYELCKVPGFPYFRIGQKILVPLIKLEEWLEREAAG